MNPTRPPKKIRKHLRELASLAYERDLNRELEALAAEFERWRGGELSPWALSECIHVFHQGPARDLFLFYRDLNEAVARPSLGRGNAGRAGDPRRGASPRCACL